MDENVPEMDLNLVTTPAVPLTRDMGTGYRPVKSKGLTKWDTLLVRVGRDRDRTAFAELFEHFVRHRVWS